MNRTNYGKIPQDTYIVYRLRCSFRQTFNDKRNRYELRNRNRKTNLGGQDCLNDAVGFLPSAMR